MSKVCIEKYRTIVKTACNELRLNYFPQVEASELLYKVISLEDIYCPLSLLSLYNQDSSLPFFSNNLRRKNFDEITKEVDKKLANLDKLLDDVPALDNRSFLKDSFPTNRESDSRPNLSQESCRVLIRANPGSGKTTFCRMLVLAILNNEKAFFDKYSQENDLWFRTESLPIMICCKHLADISVEEIRESDFLHLLYVLSVKEYGDSFSEISEDEYITLVQESKSNGLTIVIDGWDEILDEEKEGFFCKCLDTFLSNMSDSERIDIVNTIRASYSEPPLQFSYSKQLSIKGFDEETVRQFCRKWCEIIFDASQNREDNYRELAEGILNSNEPQVINMRRNPLDLSLLLTLSKNDGRLPENKSDLFKQLIDLYIYWSTTNKGSRHLSQKTLRVLLAYIAATMTKKEVFVVDDERVSHIIEQGIKDLEWAFVDDISSYNVNEIVKEIVQTGILRRSYIGRGLSFSENGGHRQMQEYLTAYAISAQYADEEYNNMSPIEIFSDKYEKSSWREIIIFVALMDNGRLRQGIVNELIEKSRETNLGTYTNLLFDIISSGADIRKDKYIAYDVLFEENITSKQIKSIINFVQVHTRISEDFIEYINTKFAESVANEEDQYGFAKAAIEIGLSIEREEDPFVHAELLTRSKDVVSIIAGTQVFLILSWCKYARLQSLHLSVNGYTMSSSCKEHYRILLHDGRYRRLVIKSIPDIIFAKYASFDDFFDNNDVEKACINLSDDKRFCEKLLSIAPIFSKSFRPHHADETVRKEYLEKLEKEIYEKEYQKIIFTFSICVSICCWDSIGVFEQWNRISQLYKNSKDSVANARKKQLEEDGDYEEVVLDHLLDKVNNPGLIFLYLPSLNKMTLWKRSEQLSLIRYMYGEHSFILELPANLDDISYHAKKLINSTFDPWNAGYLGLLAYLLRRRELKSVTYSFADKYGAGLSPEMLLHRGKKENELISCINYALLISNICAHEQGNYDIGREYLTSIKRQLIIHNYHNDRLLKTTIMIWKELALGHGEYEGIAVLSWLYELGLLNLTSFEKETQAKLLSYIRQLDTDGVFRRLENALRICLSDGNEFLAMDEDGEEIVYKMLLVKNVDGKPIVWYTDGTKDEEDNQIIYISAYERQGDSFVLNPIGDDEEEKYAQIFSDEYEE